VLVGLILMALPILPYHILLSMWHYDVGVRWYILYSGLQHRRLEFEDLSRGLKTGWGEPEMGTLSPPSSHHSLLNSSNFTR
jgi:hypothetical protein